MLHQLIGGKMYDTSISMERCPTRLKALDGVALKVLTLSFQAPALLARKDGDATLYCDGPSNPQALNCYSYVQNNLVKYTDSTKPGILVRGKWFCLRSGLLPLSNRLAHHREDRGSVTIGRVSCQAKRSRTIYHRHRRCSQWWYRLQPFELSTSFLHACSARQCA